MEVESKFKTLAEPLLPSASVQEAIDRCWTLEKQEGIGDLLRLFEVTG